MRNLAQSTRRAEEAAQDGLCRKKAEAKAKAIFDEMQVRLDEREFHHFRNHLALLLGYRRLSTPKPVASKEQVRASAERHFRAGVANG